MHVNITILEVPRHFKSRRQTKLPDGPTPNASSCGRCPNGIAQSNTASGKGSGRSRQPKSKKGKGGIGSFWANRNGSVTDAMVDRINNAVHQQIAAIQNAGAFQVSAIRDVARAIRDGIVCMYFALYMHGSSVYDCGGIELCLCCLIGFHR